MPRDIPVGNGQMLVAFDQHYQVRDLYFPHVGQENHVNGGCCRFGAWTIIPVTHANQHDRRRRRLYWTDQGWHKSLRYEADTLATDVTLTHDELQIQMHCTDVVDFHRPLLVRRVDITNRCDEARVLQLYHHNNFAINGSRVGDTVYFDPTLRCLIHYQGARYVMATWYADGEQHIDEFATGNAGFGSAEGTWRDAEDGQLGGNSIAQGAVDSTMMINVQLPAHGTQTVYLVIGCGQSHKDIDGLHRFLHRETPQGVVERTRAYWRLWLAASRTEFPTIEEGGLSDRVTDLFKRSLLVMRTQIDNGGAIIAANDSDIMQFSRDTYSYLWPRDGALVAAALDDAGFPDVARSFYSLCAKIISEHGYFLHKYNPDGTPASSWHPWISLGRPQLPIQEDETALVVWALWRHYLQYRDIEFVRPLWLQLIVPAADFLLRFRDPDTQLPLPSYDLWEERWGVNAFTLAAVYGGLQAAWQFATCFGDVRRAQAYGKAAEQMRDAFGKHFWNEEQGRFLRRIVPLDHSRTARLMGEVMAGRMPQPVDDGFAEDGQGAITHGEHLDLEYDDGIDCSLCGIFMFGLLSPHDPRMVATMAAIREKLWVKTPVGGLARYENDTYHRVHDGSDKNVPGNPWFIGTLWLAEWHVAKAKTADELRQAQPIFEWVASHALASGVLAEQVHPYTNAPLSVSPLTWSHATMVSAVVAYLRKLERMTACPSCGQPRQCMTAIS